MGTGYPSLFRCAKCKTCEHKYGLPLDGDRAEATSSRQPKREGGCVRRAL